MPTYLRLFYIRRLLDAKEKEKAEMDKVNKSAPLTNPRLPSISKR